ncbi:MAG: hypothetical protein E7L06_08245 [Schaalia turicensis]|nr:hypothetical protein [Schaalia turicensis]
MDAISLGIAVVGVAASVVSLVLAQRANQIARHAVEETHTQTEIAKESLALAGDAHELAKTAQSTAENAHLVNEFADADRSLSKWLLEVPHDNGPWNVVVRHQGAQQVRDVSIWVVVGDAHSLHRKLDDIPADGVVFDVAEVCEEARTKVTGERDTRQAVRLDVRVLVEWRGRSPKSLTAQLEDRFDYPRPVPTMWVL